jgi:hypothetical protein
LNVNAEEAATIWSFRTIQGFTPGLEDSIAGDRVLQLYMESVNVNYYWKFGGTYATTQGVTIDGTKIDNLVAKLWVKRRLLAANQELLLSKSNAGEKIPYSDAGFTLFAAASEAVLQTGVNAGHFDSFTLNMPKAADMSPAEREARFLGYSATARFQGAVENVRLDVVLTTV